MPYLVRLAFCMGLEGANSVGVWANSRCAVRELRLGIAIHGLYGGMVAHADMPRYTVGVHVLGGPRSHARHPVQRLLKPLAC